MRYDTIKEFMYICKYIERQTVMILINGSSLCHLNIEEASSLKDENTCTKVYISIVNNRLGNIRYDINTYTK